MKDIKSLREFKRIKNVQKAKKGAILWTSVLGVGVAVYYAFPVEDASIFRSIQLVVLAVLFLISAMWILVFMFEPSQESEPYSLNEDEIRLLGLNSHVSTKCNGESNEHDRSVDSATPTMKATQSTITSPSRSRLLSPLAHYPGSQAPVGEGVQSPYNDPSLYDEGCARERMHLTYYDASSPKHRSQSANLQSAQIGGKMMSSQHRLGTPGGQQRHRYQVSPMESPTKYERTVLGMPLSPGDTWTGSPYSAKMNSPAASKTRVLRDVMRVLRISDDDVTINDKCVDNLRKCLASHLQERMRRFNIIVTAIVQQLEMAGMCSQKEAMCVLEHSEPRAAFHISGPHHHRPSSYTIDDFFAYASSDIMVVKQPHPQYGGTLLENLQVYQSIMTMFYLPHGDKRPEAGHSASIGYAIERCRELVKDGRLGRFTWDDYGISSTAPDSVISDSEIVVAIFFNYCDWRAVWGGRETPRAFSGLHFQVDLAKPSGATGHNSVRNSRSFGSPLRTHHTHSRVTLVQRAVNSPHFNIYVDSETPPMELAVPPGRQNCFLAIIFFLLCTEKYDPHGSKSYSGSVMSGRSSSLPPALRDIYVDVFGELS